MSDDIKVYVVLKGKTYYLRHIDPMSRKVIQKSARTSNKRDADKAAIEWTIKLRDEGPRPTISWEAFRERFSASKLVHLAATSIETYNSSLNMFERICKPQKLAEVTTQRVTYFVDELGNLHKQPSTIAHHLRHLKAAMRWAHEQGMLNKLPVIKMPTKAKGSKVMRGRPITGEEFDRMLEAVPKIVENAAAPSWEFYLRALWLSGLRLSESLLLRWEDAPDAIVVDLTRKRPLLWIPEEAQKSGKGQHWPIPPDFALHLQSVPERDRRGRVFKLLDSSGQQFPTKRWDVGRVVAAIGKAAGIVVDERVKAGKTIRKFATAHDLRRSFGQRWSTKVMPTRLRELMRHADIGTTMRYYVGQNAEETAEALWEAFGTSSCTTTPEGGSRESKTDRKTSEI